MKDVRICELPTDLFLTIIIFHIIQYRDNATNEFVIILQFSN